MAKQTYITVASKSKTDSSCHKFDMATFPAGRRPFRGTLGYGFGMHASTRLRCLEPLRPELSWSKQIWLGFWLEEGSPAAKETGSTMTANPNECHPTLSQSTQQMSQSIRAWIRCSSCRNSAAHATSPDAQRHRRVVSIQKDQVCTLDEALACLNWVHLHIFQA